MKKAILLMIVLFVCLAISNCVTVRPYEREFLADKIMDFDANVEEISMERHFLDTREGSSGGEGGAGGGCACN